MSYNIINNNKLSSETCQGNYYFLKQRVHLRTLRELRILSEAKKGRFIPSPPSFGIKFTDNLINLMHDVLLIPLSSDQVIFYLSYKQMLILQTVKSQTQDT